jgi:hypothetical protein
MGMGVYSDEILLGQRSYYSPATACPILTFAGSIGGQAAETKFLNY